MALCQVSLKRNIRVFKYLSDAISIPSKIQDAPVCGTFLSVSNSFFMAKELENVAYFKIETRQSTNNLCKFIALG